MADIDMSRQSVVHDIPDYNTMYNTPGGGTYDYSHNIHPFSQSPSSVRFDRSVSSFDNSKPAANADLSLLPSRPDSDQKQQPQKQDPGRRRSSIGGILVSVFSGGGNKDGESKDNLDLQRTRSVPASTFSSFSRRRLSKEMSAPDLGRRRSSVHLSPSEMKEGALHRGPYAHVSKAQAEHMERLREAERNLGRKTNVDGLPLPEAQADDKRHRRRSSIANILGLNKKMLAF
ncbi:hypothetical protein DFQ27_006449 [Actinomortierella ambigua]|uniref:Uncharacterized protein n=1 Tax=Actinomortierella ambigua TaxID=1343610 RepID=A0A9P6UC42_9FUNG|nr:hypothetical protein DFQ27_006449 [Actinomortierella ambigua]